MSIPAPSNHERIMLCPPSDVLPQVRHAEASGPASRGLAIHQYLAAVPVVGWEQALAQVPQEWRADCEAIQLEHLPACQPASYAAEVCLAYDVTTGTARVMGHDLGYEEMKALLRTEEMPAKVDVIGLGEDFVLVLDYKTGRTRHGSPKAHRQLRAYGLAAARAYGKERAIVGLIQIGFDGRPWFSGGLRGAGGDDGELDALELALIEEEIREMVAKRDRAGRELRAGHLPRLTVGEHCTYCPAINGCPARTMELRTLVSGAPAALVSGAADTQKEMEEAWRESMASALAEASDEELARAIALVKVAKKRLEFMEGSLKKRAEQVPIARASDGALWGPRPQDDVADVGVARETLALLYGEDVAEAAVDQPEPTMSKASIERALRAHVLSPGMRISKLKAECYQALRDAGAIQPAMVFRWYTPDT